MFKEQERILNTFIENITYKDWQIEYLKLLISKLRRVIRGVRGASEEKILVSTQAEMMKDFMDKTKQMNSEIMNQLLLQTKEEREYNRQVREQERVSFLNAMNQMAHLKQPGSGIQTIRTNVGSPPSEVNNIKPIDLTPEEDNSVNMDELRELIKNRIRENPGSGRTAIATHIRTKHNTDQGTAYKLVDEMVGQGILSEDNQGDKRKNPLSVAEG